jgi:serine-type D-Ala-D-Ala carboxypeptidase (penicillin-binding protein 5/6)
MPLRVSRRFRPRLLRSLIGAAMAASVLAQTTLPVLAQRAHSVSPQTGEVQVKATQAILMDAETGGVLYQRGGEELIYPGNMTKLMVLAVVFKALKEGKLKLDDQLFMSEFAWRRGGAPSGNAAMFVPVGTKASVDDLLKGIVVQSGNDAAISIAENMGGNEGKFAERMTAEGRQIGLRKSTFRNATGFQHVDQQSTVRDIALLARHIIQTYPDFYQLFALKEFAYRTHKFYNRNPLLTLVPGADGLTMGFAKDAGYSMVASAKQDNRRLIVVVSGCSTADERRDDARRLLEWGLRNFQEMKLYDAGEVVAHARVWGGERLFVPLAGESDINVWLPRLPAGQKLRASVVYSWPLKAPVSKGDQVATLRVTTGSEATSEMPLYAAEDVKQGGMMRRGFDTLLYLATRWIP